MLLIFSSWQSRCLQVWVFKSAVLAATLAVLMEALLVWCSYASHRPAQTVLLAPRKQAHPCLSGAGVFGAQDAVDFAARELAKGYNIKQTCNRLLYEVRPGVHLSGLSWLQ